MPHGLLKEFKSNLSGIVAMALGRLESYAIEYATRKVNEIINALIFSPLVVSQMFCHFGNFGHVGHFLSSYCKTIGICLWLYSRTAENDQHGQHDRKWQTNVQNDKGREFNKLINMSLGCGHGLQTIN